MAKPKPPPFKVRRGNSKNVIVVDHDNVRKGWEQWYLLRSDAHQDNPDCKRELEEKHLNQALERNAGILDFGDLFCAMQGKYDKRSSKSKVREEHQVDDYLDALVSTAADRYEPYVKNWVCQGYGNHESSIKVKHETDLLQRLSSVLRDRTGSAMPLTGYTGWVDFRFKRSTQRMSYKLWHIHGYGGGGPVTKDMIQRNRQLAYVDNADIICSGHTHDAWITTDMRIKLNSHGRVDQRRVVVIKCPTYKDEYKTGVGGWHIATGKPPKPVGAWWLRFYRTRKRGANNRIEDHVDFEIREADHA